MSCAGVTDEPGGLSPGPATKMSVIALSHGKPTVAENGLPGPELRVGLKLLNNATRTSDHPPVVVIEVMGVFVV